MIDVAAQGGGKEIPIIDISNPEQRFDVSGEFINRLPLSSRQNWESVWFLVPGAVTIGGDGPDGVNFDPRIHGAYARSQRGFLQHNQRRHAALFPLRSE